MAITPDEIGATLSGFFNTGVMTEIIRWTGYIVISALILAVFVAIYFFMLYKYKVTYPILHYGSDRVSAQIIGYRKDRARVVKKEGIKKQHLLFKQKLIEPFKEEDILPGNRVNILKINEDGTYIPMPSLKFEGDISKFEQLSSEEKYWAVLQLKENASTYQNDDLQRRMMIMTIFTVIFCLVAAIIAVWLCLKAPSKIAASVEQLTPIMKSIGESVIGKVPN